MLRIGFLNLGLLTSVVILLSRQPTPLCALTCISVPEMPTLVLWKVLHEEEKHKKTKITSLFGCRLWFVWTVFTLCPSCTSPCYPVKATHINFTVYIVHYCISALQCWFSCELEQRTVFLGVFPQSCLQVWFLGFWAQVAPGCPRTPHIPGHSIYPLKPTPHFGLLILRSVFWAQLAHF